MVVESTIYPPVARRCAFVGLPDPVPSIRRARGEPMAYEVPPLPYGYDALEPHIDQQTMQLHHDKHHQAYVDKANDALSCTRPPRKPHEGGVKNLDAVPEDKRGVVRNNGGG